MTDLTANAGCPSLFLRIWQRFAAVCRRDTEYSDLTEALGDINAAGLRDMGLTWEDVLAERRR